MFAASETPWFINPVFLPAACGLLGVIVGAFITAISTYLLDERRAAREEVKEARKENLEITRAARVIDQDMMLVLAETLETLEGKQRVESPRNPVAKDGWRGNAQI